MTFTKPVLSAGNCTIEMPFTLARCTSPSALLWPDFRKLVAFPLGCMKFHTPLCQLWIKHNFSIVTKMERKCHNFVNGCLILSKPFKTCLEQMNKCCEVAPVML